MRLRLAIALLLLSASISACTFIIAPTASPTPTLTPTPSPLPTITPSPTPSPTATPWPLVTPSFLPTISPQRENPTLLENQLPGTKDWMPADLHAALGDDIAGFADQPSVNVGGTIRFSISTKRPGTLYQIKIFRLGWYGGDGARLMVDLPGQIGQAQGYWSRQGFGLTNCPTCQVDLQTGLLDTGWKTSYSLKVGSDWVSGEYLVKLVDQFGNEGYIFFVVRDDQRPSDLLIETPVNTYQAYNYWGGKSLYVTRSQGPNTLNGGVSAVKVSFNRPYVDMGPLMLYHDIQLIHFLERFGYDVTYTTNVDVDRNPQSLLNHHGFVSVGHDEYWSKGEMDAAFAARDQGVSLAFLGGNDVYGQVRYEADSAGNPYRTLVLYRRAELDPLAGENPSEATVYFADPPVNRPQNALTGTIFISPLKDPQHPATWVVALSAPFELFEGSGLRPGDEIPNLVGEECDSLADNGAQPPGLVVVASSAVESRKGPITCSTTFYRAQSGAVVFNAATLQWSNVLDDFGHHNPGLAMDYRLMRLMQNVLALMRALPVSGP